MQTVVVRIARNAVIVALFVLAAVLGSAAGALFVYAADLPQISALDDYKPNTITRVYARGGEVVGEFATERRIVVAYDQIPLRLRQAIMAAEDDTFEQHVGLSISRIAMTLFRDLMEQRKAAGASTLTQQLARSLFLTPEKTWERKIREALLAIQIEKRYTKPEVFTLYANQIYLGHGAYGVEAASRVYFNKSARDLSLEEAALIAGIIQSPSRQSPYVNMENALRRRNYALTRMAAVGYITEAEAETARRRPIVTAGLPPPPDSIAPYFVEEVRKYVEARFGAQQLYESGLTVQTALDVRLQAAASAAVEEGLRRLDKRRGWRAPKRNVLSEQGSLDGFTDPRWAKPITEGDVVPAVVEGTDAARLRVRIGRSHGEIGRDGFAWTRKTPAQLVKVGDLVEVRVTRREPTGEMALALEQEPAVEGALLAVENRTGEILAMVGGYRFERSKFNRAVQAARQLGSTFKPIVYTAAIDRGYTPASVVLDTPVSFPGGPGQPPYSPTDYDGKWLGAITLRQALEQSRNVPAVRVTDALGPKQVIQYARRFGFEGPMSPYLSLALGAAEATLEEVVTAYSVFPNQGVRMRPHTVVRVVDRQGNLVEENRPEPTDAVRADTAYVLTTILQGVVQRGTAARAAALQWPLGGKTGTTNDYTDAWFVGFDPDITVGVWVGLDQKKSIGNGETGASAALPIWMDFMKAWIGDRTEKPEFPQPGNVLFVEVDPATGAEADPAAGTAIKEVFISGTQPGAAGRQ
jgi:penicillin-binding protein 1A